MPEGRLHQETFPPADRLRRAGATAERDDAIEAFTTCFSSGERQIRVDVQRAKARDRNPAILLYHGSAGIDPRRQCMRDLARTVARHGFTALVVHYFDRTKTQIATTSTVLRHSEQWIETVTDGLSFALQQLAIDSEEIATLGFSLGGFLAVAHAARDERVRANVVISGGIDPFTLRRLERLPPTLVIHGREDRRVPKERAEELCRALKRTGTPFSARIYPGEGHVLSPNATQDAIMTTLGFLKEHLELQERPTCRT